MKRIQILMVFIILFMMPVIAAAANAPTPVATTSIPARITITVVDATPATVPQAGEIPVLKGFHFGASAGLTYPLRDDWNLPQLSYCLGFSVEYMLINDVMALSAGLVYINISEVTHNWVEDIFEKNLYYFSLPLCAKGFLSIGNFRPNLVLGLAYNTKPIITLAGRTYENSYSFLSYIVGIGCYYLFGNTSIASIELAYNKQLISGYTTYRDPNDSVMTLTAGYKY